MSDSVISQVRALPTLKETVRTHGLDANKSLGQHFLFDLNLTERVAREAGSFKDHLVIEVGPGPGGLTRALLLNGAENVVAVERDRRCIKALDDLFIASQGRLTILEDDALKVDEAAIIADYGHGRPVKIVANLPYNIGTVLLMKWMEHPTRYASLTLMFQKEVAERVIAKPNTKDYGRLAVMCQWLCDVRKGFDISKAAFVPPPKVESSVITLVPRVTPAYPAKREVLEKLLLTVFNQRRKMLRGSLKGVCDNPIGLCEKAGVNPEDRPEDLTVAQFCALATALG